MAGSERAARIPPPPPTEHADLDLGDGAIIVREFADGAFTLDVNNDRMVLSATEMQALARAFVAIAVRKGWMPE
jgi:hypothetical protein